MPEILYLRIVLALLRAHIAELRRKDGEAGYSTETVIVTAILAAAALIAVTVIAAKIRAAANRIKTE